MNRLFRLAFHPALRTSRTIMSLENPAKKLKTSPVKIGTHNGHFHADEALAVYMLRLLPEFKDAELVRSRDPALLEECDIIVDVQGQYDGTKHFDHHQREFKETFSEEFQTKLSSAGLVYKHFAPAIIRNSLGLDESSPAVGVLYKKIYKEFIEALDANDNGISNYPADVEPKFNDKGITLPSIVGSYNIEWNAEDKSQAKENEQFVKASNVIGKVFSDKLEYYGKSWLPAREIVEDAFKKRGDVHISGKIVLLPIPLPWKDHLYTIEEELGLSDDDKPLYVVYPEGAGKPNWRVQCIPVSTDSFQSRKPLPEAWRGVRDNALSEVSGIPGGVFVHASGFIGGNKTEQGVIAMAVKALD